MHNCRTQYSTERFWFCPPNLQTINIAQALSTGAEGCCSWWQKHTKAHGNIIKRKSKQTITNKQESSWKQPSEFSTSSPRLKVLIEIWWWWWWWWNRLSFNAGLCSQGTEAMPTLRTWCTPSVKKTLECTSLLIITSTYVDRFSKLFHCQILRETFYVTIKGSSISNVLIHYPVKFKYIK